MPMTDSRVRLYSLGRRYGLEPLQKACVKYLKFMADHGYVPTWGGCAMAAENHFKLVEMEAKRRASADAGRSDQRAAATMERTLLIKESKARVTEIFGSELPRITGNDWLDAAGLLDEAERQRLIGEGALTDVLPLLKKKWQIGIDKGEIEPASFVAADWEPKTSFADAFKLSGAVDKCEFSGCELKSTTTVDGKRYCLEHGKYVGKQLVAARYGG